MDPANNPRPTVVVTGAAGNLGMRLLPLLSDFSIVAIDMKPPAGNLPLRFEAMDLGDQSSGAQLTALLRETKPFAVVHLAFVIDPVRTGVLDVDRMRQINIDGTRRVIEAIAEVNRAGGGITKFVYPSSVSVYGPETPKPVDEDFPLGAHTLPYAVHKREADEMVRAQAGSMGACSTYVLRPHIYAGASVQNYLIGVLRGTATGRGKIAERLRRWGVRLPIVLPSHKYLDKKFQFVHVDDVARLIAWVVRRPETKAETVVLNVPGSGPAVPLRRCVEIGRTKVVYVPSRAACAAMLRLMWNLGVSGVPPAALPYMIGSYTMDDGRLHEFLGDDYEKVIQYSTEEALADSFEPGPAPTPELKIAPPPADADAVSSTQS